MSAGLFAVTCPECATSLELDHLGAGSCKNCGQSYLSRFGHLIPVSSIEAESVGLAAER
jgi:hypothetical protein